MTKLAIIGAAGRMGQALVHCAPRFKELSLVAAVDRPDCPLLGRDSGTSAGAAETGVLMTADLAAAVRAADVLVDFSFHTVVPATAQAAAAAGRALVLGTTGLTTAEEQSVRAAAAVIPVVWAPNMSLGVNVLFALVKQAAAALGLDYDVEIIETHHRFKKDAPSGTALRLAERVAEGRGQSFRDVACFGRKGISGDRPKGQIAIHALRMGDVVGDHTVTFGVAGERVELAHKASSRDALAVGALRAAQWVAGRKPGLYDMADVLGL